MNIHFRIEIETKFLPSEGATAMTAKLMITCNFILSQFGMLELWKGQGPTENLDKHCKQKM